MFYCRWSDSSDVYVHKSGNWFYCYGSDSIGNKSNRFQTGKELLDHLYKHKKMGHKVPDKIINTLIEEIKEREL